MGRVEGLYRETLDPDLVVIGDMLDAKDRGDEAEFGRLIRQLHVPAYTLMALKECGYADYIRERGLNTELADAEYGAGWLDAED